MPNHARAVNEPIVCILYGKRGGQEVYFDEYLSAEHIARIKSAAAGDGEIVVSEYDAADGNTDLADCLDEFFTPALWGKRRLVILLHAEALLAPAAGERPRLEGILARITKAVGSAAIDGRLVLVANALDVQKGSVKSSFAAARELIRAVEKAGGLCSCVPPYEGELRRSLVRRAAESGVKLLPAAADALMQAVGTHQLTLMEELGKLITGQGAGKIIGVEDVESLVSMRSRATGFTLAEKILDGDLPGALADLAGLREMPATRSPAYIIPAVCATFRRYRIAAEAVEKGMPLTSILAELKVPDRFQGAFAARLKRWRSETLAGLLERALECDVAVKSGTESERWSPWL
jgi:DNA polymerase III delta subunit